MKSIRSIAEVGDFIFKNKSPDHIFCLGDKISFNIGHDKDPYRPALFVIGLGYGDKNVPMYLLSVKNSIIYDTNKKKYIPSTDFSSWLTEDQLHAQLDHPFLPKTIGYKPNRLINRIIDGKALHGFDLHDVKCEEVEIFKEIKAYLYTSNIIHKNYTEEIKIYSRTKLGSNYTIPLTVYENSYDTIEIKRPLVFVNYNKSKKKVLSVSNRSRKILRRKESIHDFVFGSFFENDNLAYNAFRDPNYDKNIEFLEIYKIRKHWDDKTKSWIYEDNVNNIKPFYMELYTKDKLSVK